MSFNKNLMVSIYSRLFIFYQKKFNEKNEMAFMLWLESEQEEMQDKYEKRQLRRLKLENDDWLAFRSKRKTEDAPKIRTILLWILLIYILLKDNKNMKKTIETERKNLEEKFNPFIDQFYYLTYISEFASLAAGLEIDQIHKGVDTG